MPAIPDALLPSDDDLLYEEELLRNPFTLKLWVRYLQARRDAPARKRYLIYERALKALPGSFKLWHAYLRERREAVRGLCIDHSAMEALKNTFERALVTMHKMPRVWIEYLDFLVGLKHMTRTRRTFDRALRSLPVTQHDRIWEMYLKFVSQDGIPAETALRVFRRYLKMEPNHVEEYIEFLVSSKRWQEAAEKLAEVLNSKDFYSLKGKTKHQLWLELCDLMTRHAEEVTGLKVEAIIRGGIRKFTDEVGRLWTSLADFYIRRGLFERARDIYEEGMSSVMTVRDFSLVFDAYTQFEESMLAARMETLEGEEDEDEGDDDEDWLHNDDNDIDLRLARLEYLMDRRPELVSSVLLRQNPHNVHEWHKRVKLFSSNPAKQILTFTEAVKTVDPLKAVGKPHTLWCAFAKLYENHADLANARIVFEKAVQVRFKAVDDLAAVWSEWAEMELRHKNFAAARELMRRATAEPPHAVKQQAASEGDNSVQLQLYRSLKLWSFYVDLEESLGTLDTTKRLYDRILDLRIATPQIIINFALLLEESKFFEDSFKVYERGVQIFKYPHVKDIWTAYLTKFVARYGGKKLERARDLFEQAIEKVPAEHAKELYLQYAKLEEDFGLARHAMDVYNRATKAVVDADKMSVYELYIARAVEFFGISKTRDIYEAAINSGLPDKDVKAMCLNYAALERKLGEIDRARAIYVHASQLADPRSDAGFWETWNQFEIQHGNEDTFREMLRIKRSVSASYSQMHFILPEYLMQKAAEPAAATTAADSAGLARLDDNMAALERQTAPPTTAGSAPQFVSGGMEAQVQTAKALGAISDGGIEIPLAPNPDEIELAEEEEEAEDGGADVDVAQRSVPAAVFGDLADKAAELEEKEREGARGREEGQEPMGALERIKRQRRQ
eukprot:SM000040S14806  [mRNA]  locus=s40:534356:540087:+ [translate_table: standard]